MSLRPLSHKESEDTVTHPVVRRSVRIPLIAGLLCLGLVPARAGADVCVTIDEARDRFSPQDREAALLLLARQFELAGEHVVPPGCDNQYVVSHVQLGNTITITLSGAKGQRDATALGMDDVPAVYSQMVRSLLRGVPMTAPGIVDRTNVSNPQAQAPNRVYSDSLFYARIGYGATFGDQTLRRPVGGNDRISTGIRRGGHRRVVLQLPVQIVQRLVRLLLRTTGSSGTNGSWLKLEILRFFARTSDKSPYVGGGPEREHARIWHNNATSWSGSGLQGEITGGYELGTGQHDPRIPPARRQPPLLQPAVPRPSCIRPTLPLRLRSASITGTRTDADIVHGDWLAEGRREVAWANIRAWKCGCSRTRGARASA